jgi:hypothetical protein
MRDFEKGMGCACPTCIPMDDFARGARGSLTAQPLAAAVVAETEAAAAAAKKKKVDDKLATEFTGGNGGIFDEPELIALAGPKRKRKANVVVDARASPLAEGKKKGTEKSYLQQLIDDANDSLTMGDEKEPTEKRVKSEQTGAMEGSASRELDKK